MLVWRSTIRLDLARAFALLAALAYALIAGPLHVERAGAHAGGLATAAVCQSGSTSPAAPADAPGHDGDRCCALGCGASVGVRVTPADAPGLVIVPAAISAAAITDSGGPPSRFIAQEHWRPRGPPPAHARA